MLCAAHLDTAPPVEGQKAWCGDVKDGQVFGLGAGDSLPPITAFLGAIEAIRKVGLNLKGDLLLVANSDEITHSRGMQRVIDWVKEKGVKVNMCIIGEPVSLNIATAHIGIFEVEIEIKGKAIHPSLRQKRLNAVEVMAEVIGALRRMISDEETFEMEHPLIGRAMAYIGPIEGGSRYIGIGSTRVEPADIELGTRSWQAFHHHGGGGVAYVCPEFCKLRFGIRTIPRRRRADERWTMEPVKGQTSEELFQLIDRTIKSLKDRALELRYTIKVIQDRNLPVDMSPDEEIVKILKRVITEVRGSEPQIIGTGTVIEGSMLLDQLRIPYVQVGPTGPPTDVRYHIPTESCPIDDLVTTAEIYALSILDICGQ